MFSSKNMHVLWNFADVVK